MTEVSATVRLRPKTDARPLRHGFPWVFADQLVTDRRTRALPAGTIARLEDAQRKSLGIVAVNPKSKIIARVLDTDPSAYPDQAWFASRLKASLGRREAIFDTPYYRLVHAEADGLPGVIIDRFGSTAVIQPNAAWAENLLEPLARTLTEVVGVTTIVKNARSRARELEGLDDKSSLLCGHVEGPVQVPMNGATYLADLLGGQKTGLFYDQRSNQAFVASLSSGTNVLDVFSHVGGFALAALAGGATQALSVDASEAALKLAAAGAGTSGVADRHEIRVSDAFEALSELRAEGRGFGSVICDPPAFAPHAKARDAGLRAYEKVARLAAYLVDRNGTLTLCLCSQAVDLAQFRSACVRGIGRAGRTCQIVRTGFAAPDHPQHPHLPESSYLKAITFRIMQ